MSGETVTYYIYAPMTGVYLGPMEKSILDCQPENATIQQPKGAGAGQYYVRSGNEWVCVDQPPVVPTPSSSAAAEEPQLEMEF